MPAKTPLAGDKMDAPAACAVPFRPYSGGVVTRTRNVSEYMVVLALCLVAISGVRPSCCQYSTTHGATSLKHSAKTVTGNYVTSSIFCFLFTWAVLARMVKWHDSLMPF